MVRTETGTKKKPPTFQHLPANRAKKLKKTWVDIKKIKSKWRAEKRKEGLVGGSASVGQGRQRSDDIPEEGFSDADEADEDHDEEHVLTPSKQPPTRTHRNDSRAEHISAEQKEYSLRDMTKEAYSRSSLHTYKSDPLHRNRGRGGSSQSGREAEAARGRGRGRGQPNMKLRMGAMLEKIKRDYS